MNLEEIYEYAMAKPGTTEGFPFGEDVLVLKVMGKMFLLCNINKEPLKVNLKCEPERALELRESHEEIQPGYHMSKVHWNTVTVSEGLLPTSMVMELIDHSYELIVDSLTKAKKEELKNWKDVN